MKMKLQLTGLLLAVLTTHIAAQTQQANYVIGVVVDDNDNQPMHLANVVLINQQDSSFVTGIVTDDNGYFFIETHDSKDALIRVSFLGYQPITYHVRRWAYADLRDRIKSGMTGRDGMTGTDDSVHGRQRCCPCYGYNTIAGK
jgi:hypothetical protein